MAKGECAFCHRRGKLYHHRSGHRMGYALCANCVSVQERVMSRPDEPEDLAVIEEPRGVLSRVVAWVRPQKKVSRKFQKKSQRD